MNFAFDFTDFVPSVWKVHPHLPLESLCMKLSISLLGPQSYN